MSPLVLRGIARAGRSNPARRGPTIRRYGVIIIAAASIAAGLVHVRRWGIAVEHAQVVREHQSCLKHYQEGRLSPDDLVRASARLMDAELGLDAAKAAQARAIVAHLGRVSSMLSLEIDDLSKGGPLHARPWLEADLIADALDRSIDQIRPRPDPTDLAMARRECNCRIDELRSLR